VLGSLAASRLLRSLLFQVEPADGLVLGGVTLLVLLVATAATLLPAWHAARLDPAEVLRRE
jgi:ABC-type lipoprotein release transport system permease subunit